MNDGEETVEFIQSAAGQKYRDENDPEGELTKAQAQQKKKVKEWKTKVGKHRPNRYGFPMESNDCGDIEVWEAALRKTDLKTMLHKIAKKAKKSKK